MSVKKSFVYSFYSEPELVTNKLNKEQYRYKCLICAPNLNNKGIITVDIGKCRNLRSHLQSQGHENAYSELLAKEQERDKSIDSPIQIKTPKKRKLDFTPNNTPELTPKSFFSQVKYSKTSLIQKERTNQLTKMVIKCCLPLSIIENEGFKEYLNILDPSFNIPSRITIRNNIIPNFVKKGNIFIFIFYKN